MPLLAEAGLEGRARVVRHDHMLETTADSAPTSPLPDEIAVIQFTSGSTSSPRGVVLPHACIAANVRAIVEHLEVEPHDVGGGWLPMYHDMGSDRKSARRHGAIHRPGADDAVQFLRRPRRWLDVMERHNVSITAGPNVSYRHLLERGRVVGARSECMEGGDHRCRAHRRRSSWRPSPRPSVASGFPKSGFMPAYGLAEVGLMVTGVPATEEYETIEVDRALLEREGVARPASNGGGTRIVSCGVPVRETYGADR